MRPHTLSFLLLAAACSPRQTGEAPLTPAQVASAETANGATPMFLVTPSGDRVLSWVAEPEGETGSPSRLFVQVTSPDGNTAGPIGVLADPLGGIEPHGEAPPQLAAGPEGTLFALYTVGRDVGARFPLSALRLARSEDLGRTWDPPVTLNEGDTFGSHNFHSLLAAPDGAVYAAWLSTDAGAESHGAAHGEGGANQHGAEDHGGSRVWMRASRDGGRTWEPSRILHGEPTCPCCRTALAVGPDGTLYAAWRKVFSGDVRDIVVGRSSDGGLTWETPVRPREDGWVYPGCPHAGPSLVAAADGVVHIAWWTGKPGEAGVYYARSADRGASFTAQPIAVGPSARPTHVQMDVNAEGNVVVSWDDGLSDLPGILLRSSTNGGMAFGPEWRVSRPGVAGTFPVVRTFADSVLVAWSQVGGEAHREAERNRPDMRNPEARVGLPRVGQSEILVRRGAVRSLAGGEG